jgi:hypothetical protein
LYMLPVLKTADPEINCLAKFITLPKMISGPCPGNGALVTEQTAMGTAAMFNKKRDDSSHYQCRNPDSCCSSAAAAARCSASFFELAVPEPKTSS